MRMIEIDYEAQPPIDGYGPGGFRIGGTWYSGSVIVTAQGTMPFAGLNAEGFQPMIALASDIDVLLVGMGSDIAPLEPNLRESLENAGIGVEIMSTSSACRTYNVLLNEDRRVAAALVAV